MILGIFEDTFGWTVEKDSRNAGMAMQRND